MKYKRFVYTHLILLITTVQLASARENRILGSFRNDSVAERWNNTQDEEEFSGRGNSEPNFPFEVKKCIQGHQYEITENFSRGKDIIFNCFKTSLMLNVWSRYLGNSPQSSVKLFNGLLELKRVGTQGKSFDAKKREYVRMYRKAMQKLINERNKFNARRNITEEERMNQINRINENSDAFLSEVIRTLGDERVEQVEEERLKKEVADPRLLSVLDALSKNYMLKLRFYPGVSGRMMRTTTGGFTFDLEVEEPSETVEDDDDDDDGDEEEVVESDEPSTRELRDGEDYYDENGWKPIRRAKISKKKKKELKKKAKKLKKFLPYLLIPVIIQASLLPFVFKKLFFLAMKALFAGKVALILIGFNLLRNTCIERESYNQKIRVEHYGHRRGDEYRSFGEDSHMSEVPFWASKPVSE